MKEKMDNAFMQEIIKKDEGGANFVGYVSFNGIPKERLVTALVEGRSSIQYFDAETFELIDPKRILRVKNFTFSTSKHIEEIIQSNILFANSYKRVNFDKNNKEKVLSLKSEVSKNDSYNK